ncbi:MAG: hypothetical protein A2V96_02185 [Candidatus Yonathbacteria bacterium RBG_16_43_6]|uniref:ABC transporter substrate-binding protein n=2 Tax=Parcubacteria group TaxID=1794811 RepID=A0A1G2SD57_9BACT|nr:MAG: ABC-type metal ion transporter, periplasmic subunit [Candidatus Azambacteria bacterium GW2011_GWA1_44_9]OHA78915.1 MAG: hypothetical protein A2658_02485 [Candidatus Yonathbacteria bacterium RIFCSPHIGHO2_01_FULL_44_19]OHA79814.1 MAG: hypothetical protein A2V96_02185 [Candidatus Yonathbacteria bacterium RBG_16_43_6]OHA82973.1 MAG: hypothetical protein A3B07_03760 [Candidatus Yonathbacteria bacterium RIFCSPLOWO2_01_FULL_43_27]
MVNKKFTVFIIVFGALIASTFFIVGDQSSKKLDKNKISVVTSFYPLQYFVEAVGGDLVTVHNFTPSGSEPHDFEPLPRDLVLLGTADFFVYNGASFEPWVERWASGEFPRPKKTLNMTSELTSRGVELMVNNGKFDPHIWLDPHIVQKEIEVIKNMLIEVDPSNQGFYTENAERALQEITLLDKRFDEGLASCVLRDIVVSHEAFGYLARQYGLKMTSIAGISPDEEPSAKELMRIIDLAKEKKVKYVFFETTVSPKLAETIAREISGGVLVLNPIENLTPHEVQSGEDYRSLMEKNLINLRIALGCQG